MQAWYWTGVAISFCQTLGLHRNLDLGRRNLSISVRQRSLWRRLWWATFFRDRWAALALGRPMRINLDDCDAVDPEVEDFLIDTASLTDGIRNDFLPGDQRALAKYWVKLINLSKVLGTVMVMNYQPRRPRPSLQQIEALESDLMQFGLPDQPNSRISRLETSHLRHLHLHY